MSFALNKLNEVGVDLGSIAVVIDHFPNFQGSRKLLVKEFEGLIGELAGAYSVFVNAMRRDTMNAQETIAWISFGRETAEVRRSVMSLNQAYFNGTILDVSLVRNGSIVRGFGMPNRERANQRVQPLIDWTNVRVPVKDRHRTISKSTIKKNLLRSVLPPGTHLTSSQARGYFMTLVSAQRCYPCRKLGHK